MELPLHPKLVHLPIALAVLMPLLTSGLLLAIWRNWLPRRAWALVIAGQLLLVGSGVLAMRSGEADEERVEQIVAEIAIERHEEAATKFVWAGAILLGLSFLPLLLRSSRTHRIACAATAVGSVVVLGLGYAVGQAGGELVYCHNAAAAFATQPSGTNLAVPARRRAADADDER